jgi:cell division transport system permease protein
MKLVGATNGFIRAPFILESILLGFFAAVITTGIFYGVLAASNPSLSSFFSGYNFSPLAYFGANFLVVIFVESVGAILLSSVSSMIAITRYLKD